MAPREIPSHEPTNILLGQAAYEIVAQLPDAAGRNRQALPAGRGRASAGSDRLASPSGREISGK